jgi:hypothetical protein
VSKGTARGIKRRCSTSMESDTHTEVETHTHTHRETERERERQRQRERHRHTHRERERERERERAPLFLCGSAWSVCVHARREQQGLVRESRGDSSSHEVHNELSQTQTQTQGWHGQRQGHGIKIHPPDANRPGAQLALPGSARSARRSSQSSD